MKLSKKGLEKLKIFQRKTILLILILAIFIIGCTKLPILEGEYCTKEGTDDTLSLSKAKAIATRSECGKNFKDTHVCNEDTGTWWIGLDIEKELCNPACVINVVTKEAEINWRCTGAIQ